MSEDLIIEKLRNEETINYGFNLLIRAYQEKIYWHIRKMVIDHDDADDVTQDVFIKVWKNIHSFREESKLSTWVYRIATNECLTFLRKKKAKQFFSLNSLGNNLENKLTMEDSFSGDEIQLKLQKALLKLPDKQRMVFNMKYFDEMKFNEISEITGTSVGALKANYHHAVKKIEESLNED